MRGPTPGSEVRNDGIGELARARRTTEIRSAHAALLQGSANRPFEAVGGLGALITKLEASEHAAKLDLFPIYDPDLVVTVLGLPNTGGPAEQLDATRVDVWVATSSGGFRTEIAASGGGPFQATGLHLGLHGIRAEGTGTYTGAPFVRDVVTIKRGTTSATLVLEQP